MLPVLLKDVCWVPYLHRGICAGTCQFVSIAVAQYWRIALGRQYSSMQLSCTLPP